jgi:hypothetical protein
MTTTGMHHHLRRAIGAVKETWAEVDYAQRRSLELQLGVPMRRHEPPHMTIEELEALYAYEDPRFAA